MRKSALISILFLMLLMVADIQGQEKNRPYINPTPGEISIVASSPIPDGVKATRQSYQDLVECGFNLGMANGSVSYFKSQFSLIGNLKFKYLIYNGYLLTDKKAEAINALKNNPHFGGWKVSDEPKYADLSNLSQQCQEIYKIDPNHLLYINLIANINSRFTGNCKNFAEYLNLIQTTLSPQVWSYDYYPIWVKNGRLDINYELFYSYLEDVYSISTRTQRPFWAYCESMAYKTNSYSRPEATEEYLRWEAFSALAYGAQGIVYWTYGQRKSNSTETYLSALVNMDGKKTKAWYAAKKVNSEIKKFNNVFADCAVEEVRHTGTKVYSGTRKLTGEFGPFSKISSGEAGVMVSLIKNKGQNYVVIVSRDVQNQQNLSLELKPGNEVKEISSQKSNDYTSGQSINLTLVKGGYVIFRIK